MDGGKHQSCSFLLIQSSICYVNGLCLMFSLPHSRTWEDLGIFICFFFFTELTLVYLCLITVAFYLILVTVTMYNTILPSTLKFSTSTPKSKSIRKKKKKIR